MDTKLFYRALIADLVQEVTRPIVEYESSLDFAPGYGEDPEFMIVKHKFNSFNHSVSINDYQVRLSGMIDKITSTLEKELYNNAAWMVKINKEELIHEICLLNDSLEFKPADEKKEGKETLYFPSIDFQNVGRRETFIPGYDLTYNLDIHNENKARKQMYQELKLYANQIRKYLNVLEARVNWILEKFFQNSQNVVINEDTPHTFTKEQKTNVIKYIHKNRIQEAFDILENAYSDNIFMLKELSILKNRHSRIEQSVNSGVQNLTDSSMEHNKIIQALLALIY
jgi:hypothetical protein